MVERRVERKGGAGPRRPPLGPSSSPPGGCEWARPGTALQPRVDPGGARGPLKLS